MGLKKYLIIGGCSYGLRSIDTVVQILGLNESNLEVINIDVSASSNKYICESIMSYCDSLLKNGVNSKNILIINNFTQIGRTNPILPDELSSEVRKSLKTTEYRKYDNIDFKFYNYFIEIKNRMYSLMIGAGKSSSSVKQWLKEKEHYYMNVKNPLSHFEEYLTYILTLQTYVKQNGITIISYLMNNVFNGWKMDLSHCYNEYYDWKLPSTEEYKHISEISDITNILWNMIDKKLFVFYETSQNKYGGIDEYFIDKFSDIKYIDEDEHPNMVFYGNHPTEEVFKNFIEEIIKPKLQEWNQQHIL